MGDHNNSIAILIFLMVLFLVLSVFIPIGAKQGWFDDLWDKLLHGNHPQEQVEEVPEDDETTEPDTDDNTDTPEVAITYTDGDCCVSIYYKN